MNKDKIIFGIDVSKSTLDVYNDKLGHLTLPNTQKGFKELENKLDLKSLIVMEATGYYHYQLAEYLTSKKYAVSVVNPNKVKHYIKMHLVKAKTDKIDAKWIYEYAKNNNVSVYVSDSKMMSESKQLMRILDNYTKHQASIKTLLKGEESLGLTKGFSYRSLKRSLNNLQKEIKILEVRLLKLVKQEYTKELTLLNSIPGVGMKTSMFLLLLTDGFSKFESASQLCSYAGITPIIRESGTSIRGKQKISKMGNSRLRNLLFMCSFSAYKHNKSCKALFDRITSKGKSKKLALIAVCNKLLKQAFSIVKSGLVYDENFVSSLG